MVVSNKEVVGKLGEEDNKKIDAIARELVTEIISISTKRACEEHGGEASMVETMRITHEVFLTTLKGVIEFYMYMWEQILLNAEKEQEES